MFLSVMMVAMAVLFLSCPRSTIASPLEPRGSDKSIKSCIKAQDKIICPRAALEGVLFFFKGRHALAGLAFFFKGHRRLLAASMFMLGFCLVDMGEALRYGNPKGGLSDSRSTLDTSGSSNIGDEVFDDEANELFHLSQVCQPSNHLFLLVTIHTLSNLHFRFRLQ